MLPIALVLNILTAMKAIPFFLGAGFAAISKEQKQPSEFHGYLLWLTLCFATVFGFYLLKAWMFLAMLFLIIATPSWLGGVAFIRHRTNQRK